MDCNMSAWCLIVCQQPEKQNTHAASNKNSQLLLDDAAQLHQCFALHDGAHPWHIISILETSRVHAEELLAAAQRRSRYDCWKA